MKPATVTPTEVRRALADLALLAATFLRKKPAEEARVALRDAIHRANQILGAEMVTLPTEDPEQLVKGYIQAGGAWRELVGAVNRHAFEGARRDS